VSVPPFKLSSSSAEVFEGLVEGGGAVVTGRRTYDIAGAWGGNGPLPGLPLFVVTHNVPEQVPQGESHFWVSRRSGRILFAVRQSLTADVTGDELGEQRADRGCVIR
jgi:dihydrofolate reductase